MRALPQPGPQSAERIESVAVQGRRLEYELREGVSLNEALTAPLLAAGLSCAAISFRGVRLAPFSYVVPHPSPDAAHVAWFSPTRTPPDGAELEVANATFGWREGAPFVHVHGAWTGAPGIAAGGHALPHDTVVARGGTAVAWGTPQARIAVEQDAETNFPLFRPRGVPAAVSGAEGARLVVARLRPNQDLGPALAALCRRHGIARAALRGSLGSLIGARFADGGAVDDIATEVMALDGEATPDGARIEMLVVDMRGAVHRGRLAETGNPVCITFEAMLEEL
jgi:predicted DNA-binding protein with PD1-like motif